MLKDITLGQFFPGTSFVHRLDPRTKLVTLVLYIVALFVAAGWISYAVCFVFLAVSIAISRIPLKALFHGLKPLVFVLVLTGILNIFFTPGEPIFTLGVVSVSMEGIVQAVRMMLRILMLISATFLLTYTTSPISLTDGLESLLSPLKAIKVPVHELSMMMCIALRFIPTLIEETDKIMCAQKARGADFESGNLFARVKALIPILVPLFISAFRRADELATAMECRCYQGGEGRTKMKHLRYVGRDYVLYLVDILLVAGIIVLVSFGL